MVTESTKTLVWDELLDLARLVRYYEAMSNKFIRRSRILNIVLLLSATASIATVLNFLPMAWQAISGMIIAVLVVYGFVSNPTRKAAVLHAISMECSYLQNQLESLWVKIAEDQISDEDSLAIYNHIDERLTSITGWAGQADIEENVKLNEQCEAVADEVIRRKYYAT